jgi:23S rRNA pseudouridine955/2504/2580 synthase
VDQNRDCATPAREFEVIFEDAALVVVDKPSGVAVHGGSGVSFGVIEQLRRARPAARMLELVHRLDRETSGVLIIAKKRSALTRLHEAWRAGAIEKHYLALARGRFRNQRQTVRLPLRRYLTAEGERRVAIDEKEGQTAVSIVESVQVAARASLLRVQIETGRTHQIRVHLASLGHPILGDDKYGDFDLNKSLARAGLKRMFLHAESLALDHPLSGERLVLRSPLPAELAKFAEHILSGALDAA